MPLSLGMTITHDQDDAAAPLARSRQSEHIPVARQYELELS
jgi:hypothetical protein